MKGKKERNERQNSVLREETEQSEETEDVTKALESQSTTAIMAFQRQNEESSGDGREER